MLRSMKLLSLVVLLFVFVVMAGCSSSSSSGGSAYDNTGTLDTAFNSGGTTPGIAVIDGVAGATSDSDYGESIMTDSSNRILIAGYGANASADNDIVIIRYNTDGTLDTTFNSGGVTPGIAVADSTAGGTHDLGYGMAIDSSGKIIVTGYALNGLSNYDIVVLRYNTDGTLDTTFSGDGIAVAADVAGGTNVHDYGRSVTTDASDKILVTGFAINATGNHDIVVLRYLTDGTLDTSFGSNGIVITAGAAGGTNLSERARDITIDTSGKILVVADSYNAIPNSDIVVMRYLTDGTLDTTFSGDGIAIIDSPAGGTDRADIGYGITTDSTGRILVTGHGTNISNNNDIVVLRLKTDGTLDTTFSGDGIAVASDVAGGTNVFEESFSVVTDAFDRVLISGYSINAAADSDAVVLRYNTDGTLDTTFSIDGKAVIDGAAEGTYADDIGKSLTIDSTGRLFVTGSGGNASGDDDLIVLKLK